MGRWWENKEHVMDVRHIPYWDVLRYSDEQVFNLQQDRRIPEFLQHILIESEDVGVRVSVPWCSSCSESSWISWDLVVSIDMFSSGHFMAFLTLLKSCVALLFFFNFFFLFYSSLYVECPSLTAGLVAIFQENCFVTAGARSSTLAHRLSELKVCL